MATVAAYGRVWTLTLRGGKSLAATAQRRRVGLTRLSPRMSASDRLLWATVILAGPVDIGLTLTHWHHEGNPVVLALGPWGMVTVKAVALGGMALLWQRTTISEHRLASGCLYGLCGLYAVVAVTNLYVLAR